MLVRRTVAVVASLGVLAALTSCAAANTGREGDRVVVASFYPWAWLSERIAGDTLRVVNLTPPGVDPHDLELTSRQVIEVSRADLVVYAAGMQPAVDEAVGQHAGDRAVDAAEVVTPLPADTTPDGGQVAEGAEHARADPHIWLDPVRFATVAQQLGRRLAAAVPEHADGYRQRTAQVVRILDELDEAYQDELDSCRSRIIVTGHASFGYLADRYRLEQIPIAGISTHQEPSPARLAEVARLVEENDIGVVFLERLASNRVATALAEEVGVDTRTLDPASGLPADSETDYLSVMRDNLVTLREALGCS